MKTISATRNSPAATRVADKRVFAVAALAAVAVLVAGFAKTWFFRPLFAPQEALTLLVQAHGMLMTAWLALFVTQGVLVVRGQTALHRRVGRLGVVLLAVFVCITVPMVIIAARLGGDHVPGPPVPALAEVLGFLLTFVLFASAGLAFRRQPDVHKRLMLLAVLCAMEAGTSRLPLDFLGGAWQVHLLNDSIVLLVILCDTLWHRRLHPAFLWGGPAFICIQTLTGWISGTGTWGHVARWIIDSA